MNKNREMDRKRYRDSIKKEIKLYFNSDRIPFEHRLRRTFKYMICCYMCLYRKYEFLCYMRDKAESYLMEKYWVLRIKLCDRKKNKLGLLLGFEITPGFMGESIKLCHPNVIVNGYVGDNCIFHGNNVIGNKKTAAAEEIPVIGQNVDIGVGAIVIGKVKIADHCIIGAGAVVTKSFLTPGTVIAGVPAKEIKA